MILLVSLTFSQAWGLRTKCFSGFICSKCGKGVSDVINHLGIKGSRCSQQILKKFRLTSDDSKGQVGNENSAPFMLAAPSGPLALETRFFVVVGYAGSSLLRAGFLELSWAGSTLRCREQISHCSGFNWCRAQALGTWLVVVAAWGSVIEVTSTRARDQ